MIVRLRVSLSLKIDKGRVDKDFPYVLIAQWARHKALWPLMAKVDSYNEMLMEREASAI